MSLQYQFNSDWDQRVVKAYIKVTYLSILRSIETTLHQLKLNGNCGFDFILSPRQHPYIMKAGNTFFITHRIALDFFLPHSTPLALSEATFQVSNRANVHQRA